jgi:dihydroorotase
MELLIKGVRVVDSSQDFTGDVYIKNGKISELGQNLIKNCNVIKGEGLVLLPSFMDLHSHFRDPGFTHKEDMASGSHAAVKGGYTGVNLMANTNPVCSSSDTFKYVIEKSLRLGLVDLHQTLSITRNMEGKDISHLNELKYPIRFISDDGKGVLKSKLMLEAMLKAKAVGLTVISHAEHEEISKTDTRLSENIMTSRDITLAKHTGCHLHVAHVSTKEAMEEIIESKKKGFNITCEVTPHHIALSDDIEYTVNPPLRKSEDRDFLIKAIKDGFIDVIATDHAPHSVEDKEKGAPGISGIETAFSVCYTKLVVEGHITLNKLCEIMSKNPAKIMGFNKGEIKIGYDGDIVLVDIDRKISVRAEEFVSKGKNTPFDGMEFYGEVVTTIKGGKTVYQRGGINDSR